MVVLRQYVSTKPGQPQQDLTGLRMKPGSLNVYAEKSVELPDPILLASTGEFRGEPGFVSPVVVARQALGFALRTGSNDPARFVEIFAHTWLRDRLELEIGDSIELDLFPGQILSR